MEEGRGWTEELGFSGELVAAILGERRSWGGVNLEASRLFWAGIVEGGRDGVQRSTDRESSGGGEGAEGGSKCQGWSMITQRMGATKQLVMKHAKTNFVGGAGFVPASCGSRAVSSQTTWKLRTCANSFPPPPRSSRRRRGGKWRFWLSIDTREDQISLQAQSRAVRFAEWVPVTYHLKDT